MGVVVNGDVADYDMLGSPNARLSLANNRLSGAFNADGTSVLRESCSSITKEKLPTTDSSSAVNPVMGGQNYPQLTFKAIFVGILVGSFNSVLAMYYGLRTGVTPSLNVLAGLGGFIVMNALLKIRVFSGTFTVQENAVIQTCAVATYSLASGAGYSSGLLALTAPVYRQVGSNVAGNNAEDIIELTWLRGFGWCISVALFGFFIAFPLRNNMIIERKLIFPSGTATAVMIKTLHSSKELAEAQWKILLKAGSISYVWSVALWLFEGIKAFPIFGYEAAKFNWFLEFGPGVAAIGFMLPFSIMLSILWGAIASWALLNPLLSAYAMGEDKWFQSKDFDGLQAYFTFSAIAVILVDSVYSLVKMAYSIGKDFQERKKKSIVGADTSKEGEDTDEEEKFLVQIFQSCNVPAYVWVSGLVAFGLFSVLMVSYIFDISAWYVVAATAITPVFALGIIQGVGMTDWNVAAAVGKLVMFIFGAWSSSSIVAPLILCQATIIGCSQAADLMQDFKTGYLVGASPKAMYISQFIGAVMSCLIVPSVWVMMDSSYDIPGTIINAPFGKTYRSLAILSVQGLKALPPHCVQFMAVFAGFALFLLIFIDLVDAKKHKWAKWIPNPMAFSIGMIVPAYFSLEGIIVGAIGVWWSYRNPKTFEETRYILASGMMAGEGLFVITEIILKLSGLHSPFKVLYNP